MIMQKNSKRKHKKRITIIKLNLFKIIKNCIGKYYANEFYY